jgi:hypothetical protein
VFGRFGEFGCIFGIRSFPFAFLLELYYFVDSYNGPFFYSFT